MKPGTTIGQLQVWNIINPPAKLDVYPVESPQDAKDLIDALADEQLFTDGIWENTFGLVEWDGEEWSEWYDEDGNDIDDAEF